MTEGEAALPGRPVGDEPDAALVTGLRQGAAEAAQELCERFGPRLFAFAAAHLPGDREAALDVMVQSLADAARNIGRYDRRKASFVAWLYGIARAQVVDELRRRRRRKSVPASVQSPIETLPDTPDPRDMPTSVVERLHAQRQVLLLAESLSDLEFQVLVLRCLGKLSAREVGQVIGRSERAVHSLLHRARRKARERLMQDE